jgi:hypothetical protein
MDPDEGKNRERKKKETFKDRYRFVDTVPVANARCLTDGLASEVACKGEKHWPGVKAELLQKCARSTGRRYCAVRS